MEYCRNAARAHVVALQRAPRTVQRTLFGSAILTQRRGCGAVYPHAGAWLATGTVWASGPVPGSGRSEFALESSQPLHRTGRVLPGQCLEICAEAEINRNRMGRFGQRSVTTIAAGRATHPSRPGRFGQALVRYHRGWPSDPPLTTGRFGQRSLATISRLAGRPTPHDRAVRTFARGRTAILMPHPPKTVNSNNWPLRIPMASTEPRSKASLLEASRPWPRLHRTSPPKGPVSMASRPWTRLGGRPEQRLVLSTAPMSAVWK